MVEPLVALRDQIVYLLEILELGDADLEKNAFVEADKLEPQFAAAMALKRGPDDHKAAYICIKAGSGGREACNWAEMLLRMYMKWFDMLGLNAEMLDLVENDPDGIKTVTLRVDGHLPFGQIKDESGVHRLSRVSPFDQADRRQTSFASVEVMPEAKAEGDIVIDPKDIEMDTCCGGGPGGQKINKTEVVAIIRHLPTNIVIRSQAGRSQAHNKEIALDILRAKLTKLRDEARDAETAQLKKDAPKAAFGNEYRRTYVLSQHPAVHDHLTDRSTNRVQDVMNGDLSDLV